MNENKSIGKKNTVVPLILGILSIPGALFALLGFILAIVGIVLSAKGCKYSGMAKAALILSIIGLLLSIGSAIFGSLLVHHAMEVAKLKH